MLEYKNILNRKPITTLHKYSVIGGLMALNDLSI